MFWVPLHCRRERGNGDKVLKRCHHVENLENTGREAHTYRHHIQSGNGRSATQTVFTQGVRSITVLIF